MLTNGCATLYNRWEEADGERCVRTVLPAVFWENALEGGFAGRRYSKKGQELLSAVRVLIPGTAVSGERAYLPPKAWRLLEPQERAAYFTCQIGDLLVFGDCPYRWDPQTPLRELTRQYDETASIRLIRRVVVPSGFSHWELEGV